jgi:hypothetical protein
VVRDHLLLTVSKPECEELVAAGQARAEDCAESLSIDAKGQFDVRLRLEDRPRIAQEAEQYVALSWLPWSVATARPSCFTNTNCMRFRASRTT